MYSVLCGVGFIQRRNAGWQKDQSVKSRRLPRRVHLGLAYVVEIVLASPALLRDVMEVDDDDNAGFDGCWLSHLGDNEMSGGAMLAGRIYVNQKLPTKEKCNTYWHELGHALLDIRDWDMDGKS